MRRLRELHQALVEALNSQMKLLAVVLVLWKSGEYTGDPAADVQRILEDRYQVLVRTEKPRMAEEEEDE